MPKHLLLTSVICGRSNQAPLPLASPKLALSPGGQVSKAGSQERNGWDVVHGYVVYGSPCRLLVLPLPVPHPLPGHCHWLSSAASRSQGDGLRTSLSEKSFQIRKKLNRLQNLGPCRFTNGFSKNILNWLSFCEGRQLKMFLYQLRSHSFIHSTNINC